MVRRKKTRQNQRQRKPVRQAGGLRRQFALFFKFIVGISLVATMSCAFVLVYDVLTQCDYFKARRVQILGTHRLTEKQVAAQAGVAPGMNIFAVNLSLVRKRLLANAWIAAAEVRREIPFGLRIRIKEHTPLAIIDLGRKFLLNEKGQVFKQWTAADPAHLPLITGLQLADVPVYDPGPSSGSGRKTVPTPGQDATPLQPAALDAVMHILRMGRQSGSILPNGRIRQIRVDPQRGLTLQTFESPKIIKLGYNDYSRKYKMLQTIITYMGKKRGLPAFDRIDLNNLSRIVVNPIGPNPGSG